MLVAGVLPTIFITSVSVLVSSLSQVDQYFDLTVFFCRQLSCWGYKQCKFVGLHDGLPPQVNLHYCWNWDKGKVLKPFEICEFFDRVQIFPDVDIAQYVENWFSWSRACEAITSDSGTILLTKIWSTSQVRAREWMRHCGTEIWNSLT